MKYIVSVGGGFSSTIEMPLYMRDVLHIPVEDTEYVIACLADESDDVWRMVSELEARIGKPVTRIGYHPDTKFEVNPESYWSIWDMFKKVRFLGNSQQDPCSKHLKRETIKAYLLSKYVPDQTTICVGIGSDEVDRTLSIQKNWTSIGFHVLFPMTDVIHTQSTVERCQELLGWVPLAYLQGFPHNNCDRFCVKAGKKENARLLWFDRERYLEVEQKEQEIRDLFNFDYTIMRDRRTVDGVYTVKPLSLRDYRLLKEEEWKTNPPDFSEVDDETGCHFCGSL